MGRQEETPVDDLTRYPLPFVPNFDLPPMPPPGDKNYDRTIADFHHAVFERRVVEALGLGGAAARDSRIQWVSRGHHIRFHERWGGLDSNLPHTARRQYHTAIFGLAEYVPEAAIDFSRRLPRLVRLTSMQRTYLQRGEQFRIGNNGARVRRFLLDYSVSNGLPAVDPQLIDEFLELARGKPEHPVRLRTLASLLLQQTIEPIVTPGMNEIFAYTRKREMLRPDVPPSLGSLIRQEILAGFTPKKRITDQFVKVLAGKYTGLREA